LGAGFGFGFGIGFDSFVFVSAIWVLFGGVSLVWRAEICCAKGDWGLSARSGWSQYSAVAD
jgi:hypothetical protein